MERLAEVQRQQFDANPFFSFVEAFGLCDFGGKGYFNLKEVAVLMEQRGFFISEKDAISLMNKFDVDKTGMVNKAKFLREMQPKSPFVCG